MEKDKKSDEKKEDWVKVSDLAPQQRARLRQYWLDQGHPHEFVDAMLSGSTK